MTSENAYLISKAIHERVDQICDMLDEKRCPDSINEAAITYILAMMFVKKIWNEENFFNNLPIMKDILNECKAMKKGC